MKMSPEMSKCTTSTFSYLKQYSHTAPCLEDISVWLLQNCTYLETIDAFHCIQAVPPAWMHSYVVHPNVALLLQRIEMERLEKVQRFEISNNVLLRAKTHEDFVSAVSVPLYEMTYSRAVEAAVTLNTSRFKPDTFGDRLSSYKLRLPEDCAHFMYEELISYFWSDSTSWYMRSMLWAIHKKLTMSSK